MAGQEERQLRREKKIQKRRTARQSRARVRQALLDRAFEQAGHDPEIPPAQSVAHIHVGRNNKRQGS
ncbi:MAG: hypothetical protein AB7O62_11585 [Pirellulales bacterium]